MKKMMACFLAVLMLLSMAACGGSADKGQETSKAVEAASFGDSEEGAEESDMAYVKEKGVLVVGVTDFAPMDYLDESGEWIGFDADMARAFAERLGVEVEFVQIEWKNKLMEIEGMTVDCLWNGMTLTPDVTEALSCSNAYCNNAQIVIVPADQADKYQTEESLKELSFAVESGSAGYEAAVSLGLNYTEVQSQADALMEVAAKTSDAAIIDSLMAAAMVGEGTSYEDLTYTIGLVDEEYGVGFRKGSDLAEELNQFFKEAYEDGSMMECAEKYGVQAAIIEQ